jgi:hypothetical protein
MLQIPPDIVTHELSYDACISPMHCYDCIQPVYRTRKSGGRDSLYGDPGLLIMFKKSSSCVFTDSRGGGLLLSVMDEHRYLFPPRSLVPRVPSLPSPCNHTLSRCPFSSLKLCRVVDISKTQTRCIFPSSHCVVATLPRRVITPGQGP